MTRENAILGTITRELTRRGAWWVKTHGTGTGRNGIPDLLACHYGVFIAIETKTRHGRTRPLQAFELEQVAKAGGYTLTARSLDQVRELLDEIETIDRHRENGGTAC